MEATIYKWTDDKGKVHYSDKPKNKQSQIVEIPNPPDESSVMEAKKRAEAIITHQSKVNQINQDSAQLIKEKEKSDNSQKAELRKLCQSAKLNIINLARGKPIFLKQKGDRKHYLSDKEKNNKIDELNLFIKNKCQF